MATKPTYLGAFSSAAAQGLMTAMWIASGELPPGRRRAARAAATAAVAAAAVVAGRTDDPDVTWSDKEGLMVRDEDGNERRHPGARASAAGIALGVGMMVGRRQMEKRWLARLERNGHEHPYRALALRMGLLAMAGTLPGRLFAARAARAKSR
jgi:hypothetical protein